MPMIYDGIEGRVALVTGAASGIGEAIAQALGNEGALVAVTDRNGDGATDTANDIVSKGGHAMAWTMDISVGTDVTDTVAQIESGMGPIDMLVNVAGRRAVTPLAEMDPDVWEEVFAVNARGTFLCLQAVVRGMITRRRGAIVTIGSQGSTVIRQDRSAYGASKSAGDYTTKCLGLEVARYGIRCNVVHPGVTETPQSTANWKAGKGSAATHIDGDLGEFRVPIPLGKVAQPADTANMVLFLLSDQAAHITMADIRIDGGSALIP
jgi:2,3-dihydro-2,3-dihydroxybenzoate dehydrogenase